MKGACLFPRCLMVPSMFGVVCSFTSMCLVWISLNLFFLGLLVFINSGKLRFYFRILYLSHYFYYLLLECKWELCYRLSLYSSFLITSLLYFHLFVCAAFCLISLDLSNSLFSLPSAVTHLFFILSTEFLISITPFFHLWKFSLVLYLNVAIYLYSLLFLYHI